VNLQDNPVPEARATGVAPQRLGLSVTGEQVLLEMTKGGEGIRA